MGKKRAVSLKRIVEILTKDHPNAFTADFEENKRLISEMVEIPSKSTRNKIAGYITHHAHKTAAERVQLESETDEEQ